MSRVVCCCACRRPERYPVGGGQARGFGKMLSEAAVARILRKDLLNHRRTAAKALAQGRTVHRYTTQARARHEQPLRHRCQPPCDRAGTGGSATEVGNRPARYGIPQPVQVRETIRLPKGFSVRHNKVQGGKPGVGELTSPKPIPPRWIEKVVPLP